MPNTKSEPGRIVIMFRSLKRRWPARRRDRVTNIVRGNVGVSVQVTGDVAEVNIGAAAKRQDRAQKD